MADFGQAAIHAASLLDDLENEYAEAGIEVETGAVMVVVELSGDIGSNEEWTGVFFRCSDPRRWVQCGLLSAAKRAVFGQEE